VPGGWDVIFGEDGRQECLDFIEKNWHRASIARLDSTSPQ